MSRARVKPTFNFNDMANESAPLPAASEPLAKSAKKSKKVFDFNEFTKDEQSLRKVATV